MLYLIYQDRHSEQPYVPKNFSVVGILPQLCQSVQQNKLPFVCKPCVAMTEHVILAESQKGLQ